MKKVLKREDLVKLGCFLKSIGLLYHFDPKNLMGYRYIRLGNNKIEIEYDFAYEPDIEKIIEDVYPSDVICIGWDTANQVEKVIKEISYKLNPEKFKWFDDPEKRHWKHYEIQTRVEKCVIDFINKYRNPKIDIESLNHDSDD